MDLFLDPTRLLLWLRRTSIKTFVSSFNKKVSLYFTLWWVCHLGTAFHAAKLHRSGRFRQRLRNLFDEARDVGLDCYGCTGHQAAHYSRPHVARFQARNTHRQSFLEEGTKASYIYKYITKWNKTFNKQRMKLEYVYMYVCMFVCMYTLYITVWFPLKNAAIIPSSPEVQASPPEFPSPWNCTQGFFHQGASRDKRLGPTVTDSPRAESSGGHLWGNPLGISSWGHWLVVSTYPIL